jgi:hypothetical protein
MLDVARAAAADARGGQTFRADVLWHLEESECSEAVPSLGEDRPEDWLARFCRASAPDALPTLVGRLRRQFEEQLFHPGLLLLRALVERARDGGRAYIEARSRSWCRAIRRMLDETARRRDLVLQTEEAIRALASELARTMILAQKVGLRAPRFATRSMSSGRHEHRSRT